ncbi:kinase-like protein [Trichodelitschia bisporula]|uniref:EKC/KEOPS complex subunit BUD32 n=1 Tax=Trichodelitschia bisporula TaxID=703511 RepID=A0A6G1I914_9PEZI|nr:kinase-like protein [Trichodelitschia bisporula]
MSESKSKSEREYPAGMGPDDVAPGFDLPEYLKVQDLPPDERDQKLGKAFDYDTTQYTRLGMAGSGGEGTTDMYQHKRTNAIVIKKIHRKSEYENVVPNEMNIFMSLLRGRRSPHVVNAWAFEFVTPLQPALWLEYIDGPTMADWQQERMEEDDFSEALAWHTVFHLCAGIAFLHTGAIFDYETRGVKRAPHGSWVPIVHRDISFHNIMMRDNYPRDPTATDLTPDMVLVDLGNGAYINNHGNYRLAKELEPFETKIVPYPTMRYGVVYVRAPEHPADPNTTEDVWQVGHILATLMGAVMAGSRPKVMNAGRRKRYSSELGALVNQMLDPDPGLRPTTDFIVDNLTAWYTHKTKLAVEEGICDMPQTPEEAAKKMKAMFWDMYFETDPSRRAPPPPPMTASAVAKTAPDASGTARDPSTTRPAAPRVPRPTRDADPKVGTKDVPILLYDDDEGAAGRPIDLCSPTPEYGRPFALGTAEQPIVLDDSDESDDGKPPRAARADFIKGERFTVERAEKVKELAFEIESKRYGTPRHTRKDRPTSSESKRHGTRRDTKRARSSSTESRDRSKRGKMMGGPFAKLM